MRFDLPDDLSASEPVTPRDSVRLLVAEPDRVRHAQFRDLPEFLAPGDVLVVNNSPTLPAAVDGHSEGRDVVVHFSTPLHEVQWVVEVRPAGRSSGPAEGLRAGEVIDLPDGVSLTLVVPFPPGQPVPRLWLAKVDLEGGVPAFLARTGRPVRYSYVPEPIPIEEYQTVFATPLPDRSGSAEMPSAARPFTAELVTRLVAGGVAVVPITLHTGVSSPEAGEPPMPERFRVPALTAAVVNAARRGGGRVIAVGTTVTRALETSVEQGSVRPGSGWTDLVLGARRPARVVDSLITGWHAPGASHLDLLEAVAGRHLVERAYREALAQCYRWHEFGDSCLLVADRGKERGVQ
jgi:S-adenosylmethionine:tRNA ribosyltransferase-isomerase